MHISLIANSGIQFYEENLSINPNADLIANQAFRERESSDGQHVILEHAEYLPNIGMGVYASKRELLEEGFLNPETGRLFDGVNPNRINILKDAECYPVNDVVDALEVFANEWLPLPYFLGDANKLFQFGPTNWCRIKLIPLDADRRPRILSYKAILVFDTQLVDDIESPFFDSNIEFAEYDLCNNEDQLLNFCDEQYGGGWVFKYLKELYHKYLIKNGDPINDDFPVLKYLGQYIYLIQYLAATKQLPGVLLYSNNIEDAIDVDLVLDIGNSRTCGVLFESDINKKNFEFTQVKKLRIQDLSEPGKHYDNPFSMRLAFYVNSFGEMGGINQKFQWPSFVRVGKEARRLIYNAITKGKYR